MTARADKHPFAAPSAVFVMGPTASGKSEFAFRLAGSVGGAVTADWISAPQKKARNAAPLSLTT